MTSSESTCFYSSNQARPKVSGRPSALPSASEPFVFVPSSCASLKPSGLSQTIAVLRWTWTPPPPVRVGFVFAGSLALVKSSVKALAARPPELFIRLERESREDRVVDKDRA